MCSGKLKIGFENHDHGYKRTKRLKGGQEDVNGTLYIGDGCLGKLYFVTKGVFSLFQEYQRELDPIK